VWRIDHNQISRAIEQITQKEATTKRGGRRSRDWRSDLVRCLGRTLTQDAYAYRTVQDAPSRKSTRRSIARSSRRYTPRTANGNGEIVENARRGL
jgi:hypothetical protein